MNPSTPVQSGDSGGWKRWDQFQPSVFRSNLAIVQRFHPALHTTLESFVSSMDCDLRAGESGATECAARGESGMEIRLSGEQWRAEAPRLQASLQSFSSPADSTVIFHLGCDLGNTLTPILQHLNRAPQKAIVFVEPDAVWFVLTLAARSFEALLESNRCFFAIGEGWLESLEGIFDENHFFAIERPDFFFSATARRPERLSYWTTLKTKIGEWIGSGRERYARELEEMRAYYAKKPVEPIRRVLALYMDETNGKAIPYIQRSFLDECQRLGLIISYHHPSFRSDIGYMRTIAREKPDLLLFINKSPGEFTDRDELDRLRLPRMIWCMDDPNCFVREPFGANDFVFTWDRSYRQNLLDMQARGVDHFPYVADLDGAEIRMEERFRSPVSFIGQVKAFSAAEYGLDEPTGALIERVAQLKAQTPGLDYQRLILGHQNEFGLTMIRSESDAVPPYVRYGIYIAANGLRRIALLECARPFGLKIYGNDDWLILLGDRPLRDCYAGPADPQRDVPPIFASSTINLNIHSLQALTSLNQRDFNCPLVGGFLLTDWVEGADEFYRPDEEMVFYRSGDDLKKKIEYYLNHEEERREIVRRGRERVLREHTYASRAPRVLETLNGRIRERYE